jgi:hypothetical protein
MAEPWSAKATAGPPHVTSCPWEPPSRLRFIPKSLGRGSERVWFPFLRATCLRRCTW